MAGLVVWSVILVRQLAWLVDWLVGVGWQLAGLVGWLVGGTAAGSRPGWFVGAGRQLAAGRAGCLAGW